MTMKAHGAKYFIFVSAPLARFLARRLIINKRHRRLHVFRRSSARAGGRNEAQTWRIKASMELTPRAASKAHHRSLPLARRGDNLCQDSIRGHHAERQKALTSTSRRQSVSSSSAHWRFLMQGAGISGAFASGRAAVLQIGWGECSSQCFHRTLLMYQDSYDMCHRYRCFMASPCHFAH